MYDPMLVEPMRREAVAAGCVETRTPEAVKKAVQETKGTVLVFVNSVCGCAAGGARPALRLALASPKKPTQSITMFAGNDREATVTAREFFKPYQPSSPQMGLLKDGKLVFMLQRHDIEGRPPEAIANELKKAFELHC
ncbi:MAG TPA: BrxA/BrxB family bacilliredoxin [Planctomycetota bacterium]|nr:BrxA/BrxB family bacilliredoxin [Planctomycetota bacterium]